MLFGIIRSVKENKKFKIFVNPEFKLSIKYPSDLKTNDFLSKYTDPMVTSTSFKPDEPSEFSF